VPTTIVHIDGTGGSSHCVASATHATQGVVNQRRQMPAHQQVFTRLLCMWVVLQEKAFFPAIEITVEGKIWQT